MMKREAAVRLAVGAAACLLLASGAEAQQYKDSQQGAGGYETLGGTQQAAPQMQGGMPDVSGIQQQMQAQMMQQMAQQMQAASPAAQMQNAAQQAAPQMQGGMPDVSGIQQNMQAQMMQQMQAASPAAQMQGAAQQVAPAAPQMQGGGGVPDINGLQQQMRAQMMQQMAPAAPAAGGFPVDGALSSLKIDPATQAAMNAKMAKIVEQTMQETLSNPTPTQFTLPANGAAPQKP